MASTPIVRTQTLSALRPVTFRYSPANSTDGFVFDLNAMVSLDGVLANVGRPHEWANGRTIEYFTHWLARKDITLVELVLDNDEDAATIGKLANLDAARTDKARLADAEARIVELESELIGHINAVREDLRKEMQAMFDVLQSAIDGLATTDTPAPLPQPKGEDEAPLFEEGEKPVVAPKPAKAPKVKATPVQAASVADDLPF